MQRKHIATEKSRHLKRIIQFKDGENGGLKAKPSAAAPTPHASVYTLVGANYSNRRHDLDLKFGKKNR